MGTILSVVAGSGACPSRQDKHYEKSTSPGPGEVSRNIRPANHKMMSFTGFGSQLKGSYQQAVYAYAEFKP